MNTATFVAELDRTLVHRAHLLALAGNHDAAGPGYARADARLRPRGAPAPMLVPSGDIASLFVAGRPPAKDAQWFARRWDAGDAASCQREASRLAVAAHRLPHGGVLDGWRVGVRVAVALRPTAWPGPADDAALRATIAAGPEAPGATVILAAVAARMPYPQTLSWLPAQDLHIVRLHIAGTAIAKRTKRPEELAPLLRDAAHALLPPQHQGHRVTDLVGRLTARDMLDQPPGEVERLTRGLAQRHADRLHRAWLRAFFVPRGYPLDAWLDGLDGL